MLDIVTSDDFLFCLLPRYLVDWPVFIFCFDGEVPQDLRSIFVFIRNLSSSLGRDIADVHIFPIIYLHAYGHIRKRKNGKNNYIKMIILSRIRSFCWIFSLTFFSQFHRSFIIFYSVCKIPFFTQSISVIEI